MAGATLVRTSSASALVRAMVTIINPLSSSYTRLWQGTLHARTLGPNVVTASPSKHHVS
jgi:hypothetical protein